LNTCTKRGIKSDYENDLMTDRVGRGIRKSWRIMQQLCLWTVGNFTTNLIRKLLGY